jgi:hypothetical protein
MKYGYSVAIKGKDGAIETLSVDGCDSFDEALNRVERGLYERKLALAKEAESNLAAQAKVATPTIEIPPANEEPKDPEGGEASSMLPVSGGEGETIDE